MSIAGSVSASGAAVSTVRKGRKKAPEKIEKSAEAAGRADDDDQGAGGGGGRVASEAEAGAGEAARPFPLTGGGAVGAAGFARWHDGARGLGLGAGEMLWELHVVQGRHLAEAARLLGLEHAQAVALLAERRALAGARAPRSEADFHAAREELRDRLLSILEDACRAPEDPRLLAVRQRVCDQMADLYGLKMARRGGAEETQPRYTGPEGEQKDQVLAVAMGNFGRLGDLAEITAARDREEGRKILG